MCFYGWENFKWIYGWWKKVDNPNNFNLAEDFYLVEASFLQEYKIDLEKVLKTMSARKFLNLLKGITDKSALGIKLQNEYMKNNSGKSGKQSFKFNLKNKNSVKQMGELFKSIGKGEDKNGKN